MRVIDAAATLWSVASRGKRVKQFRGVRRRVVGGGSLEKGGDRVFLFVFFVSSGKERSIWLIEVDY